MQKTGSWFNSFIWISAMALGCYACWTWIDSTAPKAEQVGATKKSAIPVEFISLKRSDHRPVIRALGKIIPARELQWTARVAGDIIERSSRFEPGILIEKDELLLKIEDTDYQLALKEAQSEVQFATSTMRVEEGNQILVKEQVKMYDQTIPKKDQEFMYRKPQIAAAKSKLEQAKARVDLAKLDLERTIYRAPFSALIMEREVEVGQRIGVGQKLGRLVDISKYWVKVSVPLNHTRWIEGLNHDLKLGSKVLLKDKAAWGDQVREGNVLRQLGTLEEKTRLAQILVQVEDPLALKKASPAPTMILETIVQVEIEGQTFKNCFRLPRSLLRKGQSVWVMREDKLQILTPSIIMMDSQYAYIKEGFNENEQVITTNLSRISEGLPLQGQEVNL